MQMNLIFSDNVRSLCLFCNVKDPNTSYNRSKISRHKRSHSCFMVSSMKFALTLLPFLTVAHDELGTSRAIYIGQ